MSHSWNCSNCSKIVSKNEYVLVHHKLYCLNCSLIEYRHSIASYLRWRQILKIGLVIATSLLLIYGILAHYNLILYFLIFFSSIYLLFVFFPLNTYFVEASKKQINFITEVLTNGLESVDQEKYMNIEKNYTLRTIKYLVFVIGSWALFIYFIIL